MYVYVYTVPWVGVWCVYRCMGVKPMYVCVCVLAWMHGWLVGWLASWMSVYRLVQITGLQVKLAASGLFSGRPIGRYRGRYAI